MLSPQHKEAPPILVYYHELANRELIRNVFLMFIREIESEFSDLIIKSNNLAFHPSTISVDGFDEDDIALAPINIEVFHGFIFINALPKTSPYLKPFKSWIGDLPRHMQPWYVTKDEK